MVAGDTLNIRAGTYTENNMTINLGGTNTIQAYNSEAVTIHNSHQATDTGQGQCGDNSSGVQTIYPAGSNVTFIGIKFTGSIGTFNEEYNAVAIGMGSSGYLIIDNCEFTGFNHVAIKHSGRLWLKNSYIHDLGVTAGDHGVYSDYRNATNRTIIEHNYFENITGAGLQQYGDNDGGYWIVRYNIFRNCGKNYNGPICGGGGWAWGMVAEGDHNEFYNNVVDGSHWGFMFYKEVSSNNIVKNNIFQNCDYGVIDDAPGAGNLFDYNYFRNNTTDWSSGANGGHNIQNDSNPFAAGSQTHWYDYRLSSGGGCTNTGTNLGAGYDQALNPNDITWPPSVVDQDSYGNWEIGAFVYGAGDTTPPVISNPLPTGVSQTISVTLQVITDENAICKYSTTDVAYDSMANTFSTTGGTTHQQSITCGWGTSYTYYVRAMDTSNNKSTSSTTISFSTEKKTPFRQ